MHSSSNRIIEDTLLVDAIMIRISKAVNLQNYFRGYERCFSNGSSLPNNVKEAGVEKTPITAQLWQQRQSLADNDVLEGQACPVHLVDKTPIQSKLSINYSFTSESKLRDLYVDSCGNVLIGKLFEDLDALAGNIAFLHSDDNNPLSRPLSLVTASVDRITLHKSLPIKQDLVMVGQIALVGRSSLDVAIEVHSKQGNYDGDNVPILFETNSSSRLISSIFTYVARDRSTGKAATVNRFVKLTAMRHFFSSSCYF